MERGEEAVVTSRPAIGPADDMNLMYMPFVDYVHDLGWSQNGHFHHYDAHSLFWSMSRLFGFYERLMATEGTSDPYLAAFIDSDLEGFIIRLRVVLNDIAYIIRQIYPRYLRNLSEPSGPGRPGNWQFSYRDLIKFLRSHREHHPELADLLLNRSPWMNSLREQRDRILHYKAKVLVFTANDGARFFQIAARDVDPRQDT